MSKVNFRFKILFLIIVIIFLIGCQEEQENVDDVTLKLKWLHQSQFAGNYVAKEKGFYQNENLNVTLLPFDFKETPIDSVVNGNADFGITGADELMLARAQGKPVKAIAVIYKINPVCAYTLKSSGITKPQDFIGKTVGIERTSDGSEINVGILYKAMMSKLEINRSEINEITIGYDPTELVNGEVDVSTGYIINEPYLAIEAGHEINLILMADYGVNMYADVLFTSDYNIQYYPNLVKRFLKSTLEGWQYAIENDEEAVEYVLKYTESRSREHELNMLKSSIPLIHTGEGMIGLMKIEEWQNVEDILIEQNILTEDVNLDEIYTNEFLEEIYENQ